MENVGDIKVQLRERTWCIFSNADNKESVTGKGVVGQVRDVSSSSSIILILGSGSHRLTYTDHDLNWSCR